MSQSYASYLHVNELLELQHPLSDGPEHDELLFIIIHQVYELWFKQVLHEADLLCRDLSTGEGVRSLKTLGRMLRIMQVMNTQIGVLETMTPLDFLSFRARLESASGFQSFQFRELELLLGAREPSKLKIFAGDPAIAARLERRMQAPSLWDCFISYLRHSGALAPALADEAADRLQTKQALLAVYRNTPQAAALAEALVDLDETLQEWRYRHVKMVQRTIGSKPGTGGSEGVGYLASTLMRPVFPLLWEIRGEF